MNAWNMSTDQLTLSSEASEILNVVSQDLQAAVFRRDGSEWLYVGYETPAPAYLYAVDSRLIFFAPTPLRATKDTPAGGAASFTTLPGDLCAIEYRVEYADPFGVQVNPQKVFSLHRVVIDSATTFLGYNHSSIMGLKGGTNLLDTFFTTNFDSVSGSGNITSTLAAGTSAYNGKSVATFGAQFTQSSLGLDNIAQFTVILYYNGYKSGATPPIQVYGSYAYNASQPVPPSGTGYAFGGSTVYTSGTTTFLDNTPTSTAAFLNLAYADVTLSLFTDEGLQLFEALNGSVPDGGWNVFLQQYAKTYTRRVVFQNKPQ
jgi:hypothetical protein